MEQALVDRLAYRLGQHHPSVEDVLLREESSRLRDARFTAMKVKREKYDFAAHCWVAEPAPLPRLGRRPGKSAHIQNDALAAVEFAVVDKVTGVTLWKIRAEENDARFQAKKLAEGQGFGEEDIYLERRL